MKGVTEVIENFKVFTRCPQITTEISNETVDTEDAEAKPETEHAGELQKSNNSTAPGANLIRQMSKRGHKWHPTASKCCLHQTMERRLRAAKWTPKAQIPHYCTGQGRASRLLTSTQRVQNSPFITKGHPRKRTGPWTPSP